MGTITLQPRTDVTRTIVDSFGIPRQRNTKVPVAVTR
jgi:hypothetical protein